MFEYLGQKPKMVPLIIFNEGETTASGMDIEFGKCGNCGAELDPEFIEIDAENNTARNGYVDRCPECGAWFNERKKAE